MEKDELRKGVEYGFIDHNVIASDHYSPKLVTNNYSRGEKVIQTIKSELSQLKKDDEFMFSVAFITEGGIQGILMDLEELQKRGVKGKIVASQYQNFTRPKALKKLLSFDNIEVRVVTEEYKMHTKCYIFKKGTNYDLIIGSSNLTAGALTENEEWNLKFSSTEHGGIVLETIKEFNSMFERAVQVDESWITQYSEIYDRYEEFRSELEKRRYDLLDDVLYKERINPNQMQVSALESTENIRSKGSDRALLISATGTGKTYLAAFDVKKFNPKRLLFLVHREIILKKAMESFERVVGKDKKIGLLSGNSKDYEADYLFSTVQTMSQDYVLSKFPKDHFDYIVMDEAHHMGAKTYRKIIDYFNPKFNLGMTATPERTDGFDIFKLYDYKIAFEIRLKDAMQHNMVCPFHYYGINDIFVNEKNLEKDENFNRLVSDERVKHIIDKINFYGYSGDRARGIVFCEKTSGKRNEAKELSEKFNQHGYKTTFLTAESSQQEREDAIQRLESKEREDQLDYIFVIDIFNEGVDIPSVNQIIMLRPTESPIIFIQQLGRGLRHSEGKEYLVVIDFIGNYDNNYLIPIALSGDTSYKKDNVRRFTAESNGLIPGTSTVSFDEITKQRVLSSIDSSNFSDVRIIKDAYSLLKMKLGRIPDLVDFKKFGSIDALKFVEKFSSYYNFLVKYEKDYVIKLSKEESELVEHFSKIICPGKREHELVIFENIIEGKDDVFSSLEKKIPNLEEQLRKNVVAVLNGNFYNEKYDILCESGTDYSISEKIKVILKNPQIKSMLIDILNLGRENFEEHFSERYKGSNFTLYQKYTYEDVCRLLNWDKSVNAINIGGYKYDQATNTFPVFINYVKGEDVAESQRYEDHFVNPSVLVAAPKSTEKNRNAKNLQRIENSKVNRTKIPLFVRKNKDDREKKEFYYLGDLMFNKFIESENAMMIEYSLLTPVVSEIYDYLTHSTDIGE